MKRSTGVQRENNNKNDGDKSKSNNAVAKPTKKADDDVAVSTLKATTSSPSLRMWQWRVFLTLYVGFVAYTVCKRSLGFAAPQAIIAGELTPSLVGLLSTALSTAFAVGKLFGGILCDLYNPIVLMALGLAISGLATIGLASAESATFMFVCWTINGFAQSPAWPPVALLMTRWFADHERASWWSVMSSAQTAGAGLAAIFITRVGDLTGSWRVAMSAAGTLGVAMSLLLVPLLALWPADVGLKLVDAKGNAIESKSAAAAAAGAPAKLPLRDILAIAVKSRSVWMYSLASVALYVVKEAFATWFLFVMMEMKVDRTYGIVFLTCFEAAGVPGCIASAVVSSRVFGNRRSTTAMAFTLPVLGALLLLLQLDSSSSWYLFLAAMTTIGFSVNAIQTMIGMGYVEENDKRCSGTISGIVGSASYIGAAMAGSPMAARVANDVRTGFFYPLLVAAAVVVLFLGLVPKPKPAEPPQAKKQE